MLTEDAPVTSDLDSQFLDETRREQEDLAVSAIDREVAELNALITKAQSYQPEAVIALEFVKAFPPTEPGYMGQMRSSIGVGAHSLNGFLIMWNAHRLQDVKPRVAWLAQRLGKFTIEDYPEMGRRTYDFGRLKFSVFFNSYDDKTVCKFVEVGKEEKPIYKLMCGDVEEQEVNQVVA